MGRSIIIVTVDYIDDTDEEFVYDKLGNRTGEQDLREGTENYVVDPNTNRYDSVGGGNLTYDAAGNLTVDADGYEYEYDYENRLIKITKGQDDIAEYAYDALGRRIQVYDMAAETKTWYYYNDQ